MNKTTSGVLLIAGTVIFGAANNLAAQPSKNIFVDVNLGIQPASRLFSVEALPVVYGEVAIVRANQGVDGGGLMDVVAGYRVWRDFSVALGLTTTLKTSGVAEVTGGIPHPLFYDTRVETDESVRNLKHREQSAHLSFMWSSPVTDKIDASVMAGPSYLKVFQDLVVDATVRPGTQSFTPITGTQTATVFGFHFGGDLTYLITSHVGAGATIRFVRAQADLPAVPKLDVAGFQIGIGGRIRF